jgi:hypothetical protein
MNRKRMMSHDIKDLFMYALAAFSTLGFIILCAIIFIYKLPPENHDIASILLGQFAAIEVMVYSYFFGSSKSSADQRETVNRNADSLANNTVTHSIEKIDSKIN